MFDHDYTISGRHATYIKFLAKKNAQDEINSEDMESPKLFSRYIDVYMNAAVFGLLYNRTAKKDTTSTDRARIYADAFSTENANCIFLYKLVMLLEKKSGATSEEKLNRAFRFPSQPEKQEEVSQCLELFHDYVRGGIEVMYDHFIDGCQTQDDYINRSHEVMERFKNEFEGESYEEALTQMIGI